MPAHVEVSRPRRLDTRRAVAAVLVTSEVSIHRLEYAVDRILLGQGVGGHGVRYRIVLEASSGDTARVRRGRCRARLVRVMRDAARDGDAGGGASDPEGLPARGLIARHDAARMVS